MNFLIMLSIIVLTSTSDTCKVKLDAQLGANEVFIYEHPFENNLQDFKGYYCPTIDELQQAKNLLIVQYNDLMKTIPGSSKHYTPLEDVRDYLNTWKIQYYSFKTTNGKKRVFMNLIKDTEQNKGVLEDWRTGYVYNLSEGSDQLMLNFLVDIEEQKVSF